MNNEYSDAPIVVDKIHLGWVAEPIGENDVDEKCAGMSDQTERCNNKDVLEKGGLGLGSIVRHVSVERRIWRRWSCGHRFRRCPNSVSALTS